MLITPGEILGFPRYGGGVGKHLVTSGVAWRPVSNTGAAQGGVGSHR